VLEYVRSLYQAVCAPGVRESAQVQKMKKYMNYLGVGVDSAGQFLHQIRRVSTKEEFFRVCEEFLGHDRPMFLDPLEQGPRRQPGRQHKLLHTVNPASRIPYLESRIRILTVPVRPFHGKRVGQVPYLANGAAFQQHSTMSNRISPEDFAAAAGNPGRFATAAGACAHSPPPPDAPSPRTSGF